MTLQRHLRTRSISSGGDVAGWWPGLETVPPASSYSSIDDDQSPIKTG
jgi:hypothetical protein